ncbi:MAG: cryptochrome/photolyase family protein, partial [Planctomycetaceae bacterium]
MLATLIYPHQLYERHPGLTERCDCVLVEDPLFFTHERFHFQKLVLHRAAFAEYATTCERRGHRVLTAPSGELTTTHDLAPWLQQRGYTAVRVVDPCDDWLERRLRAGLARAKIGLTVLPDPHFLTSREELSEFAEGNARWYFTDFYIRQRRRHQVLLTPAGKPVGGQWSFDPENRRKL